MSESTFAIPELPDWRVRIVAVDGVPASQPIVFFCKLERRKKSGKWVTTVLGFRAYGDAFEAIMGASGALQTIRNNPRKVRAGIIRPFQDGT